MYKLFGHQQHNSPRKRHLNISIYSNLSFSFPEDKVVKSDELIRFDNFSAAVGDKLYKLNKLTNLTTKLTHGLIFDTKFAELL